MQKYGEIAHQVLFSILRLFDVGYILDKSGSFGQSIVKEVRLDVKGVQIKPLRESSTCLIFLVKFHVMQCRN